MRYMLLIYDEEAKFDALDEAGVGELMGRWGEFHAEIEASGIVSASDRLTPTNTATTVRRKSGDRVTMDGPFAETKEQLGGYYVIDVKDLDEAIAWAAKCPSAEDGSVEVRPIWEMEG